MLSVVIYVHRNISAAQTSVKFCGNEVFVNGIEIIGTKNFLTISVFGDKGLVHKAKILTPENLFIPRSVSSDTNISLCISEKDGREEISEKLQELKVLSNNHINCESSNLPNGDTAVLNGTKVSENTQNSVSTLEIKEDYFKLFIKVTCSNNHSSGCQHIIKSNFRIQLTNSELIACSNNIEMTLTPLHKFLKSQIHSNDLYNVMCTNCDNKISGKSLLLTDVKEYNGNISDLCENWFCHKHDSAFPVMGKEILYADDLCMLLNSSFVENSFLEKQGSEYKCKACNNILTSGVVTYNHQDLRRFFVDAVKLSLPCSMSCYHKKYRHDIVMLCLLNIIKNNMSDMSACKLYFQSNVEGDEDCLLLHILPFQATQFALHKAIENTPAEINFITDKVYKVQYHINSKSSAIVKLWRREFDVEFFKVSNFFMELVIQHLKSSSDCIFSGQTAVKGFLNACLPSSYENCVYCSF